MLRLDGSRLYFRVVGVFVRRRFLVVSIFSWIRFVVLVVLNRRVMEFFRVMGRNGYLFIIGTGGNVFFKNDYLS